MPLYFFSVSNGSYSSASDCGDEFVDRDAAWKELTRVCGDMVGGISRRLKEDGEWQMELLDEWKKPVFRIRSPGCGNAGLGSSDSAPAPGGTYRIRKH